MGHADWQRLQTGLDELRGEDGEPRSRGIRCRIFDLGFRSNPKPKPRDVAPLELYYASLSIEY